MIPSHKITSTSNRPATMSLFSLVSGPGEREREREGGREGGREEREREREKERETNRLTDRKKKILKGRRRERRFREYNDNTSRRVSLCTEAVRLFQPASVRDPGGVITAAL